MDQRNSVNDTGSESEPAAGECRPTVSVVVPVFNAERTIAACIDALLAQSYPPERREVIVVDNGSTDGTLAILEKRRLDVTIVTETRRGPSAARNAGIRQASHPLIAFIDSDCVAERTWLEEMIVGYNANPAASFFGGAILALESANLVARYAELLFDQRNAVLKFHPPRIITANCLMRRRDLLDLGLFDEAMMLGEDVDICYRGFFGHGALCAYVPDAIVRHHNPDSLTKLFRKGVQHGRGSADLYAKHAAALGRTRLGVCLNRRRYGHVIGDFFRFVAIGCGYLVTGGRMDRTRYVEPLCGAVFNGGKQVGFVSATLRDVMTGARS